MFQSRVRFSFLITLLAALCLFNACSNIKYLPQGKSLHTATVIKIDPDTKITDKYTLNKDMLALARPKPNKKMLGVARFKLSVYNRTLKNKGSFVTWLHEKIGEAPVLVDTAMLDRTRRNMQQYMFNHGYFNNVVKYSTKEKNRRTKVTFNISAISPYMIRNVYFPPDTADVLQTLVHNMQDKSGVQPEQEFNIDKLQEEVNRITYELRCKGYFDFISKNLTFELDSSLGNRSLDIYLKLKPPTEKEGPHKAYTINNIYIFPDYEVGKSPNRYTDTIVVNDYHFISSGVKFNAKTISSLLLIKKGRLYSQKDWEYSLNHLLGLGVYKFVNVKFEKTDSVGNNPTLDCRILLTPAKRMSVSGEVEVNNRAQQSALGAATSSLLGTAASVSYRNKNLLGGAESFSFNLFGGLELNPQRNKENLANSALINTMNFSGELQLVLPKFIVPFKLKNQSRYFLPKTNFRVSANYLRRFNFYTLYSFNVNFGYDWNENNRKRHLLNPISVSLLSLQDRSTAFEQQLSQNPYLRRSFEEQIIAGANYAYIFNTQNLTQQQNFIFMRTAIDIAGNTFFGVDQLLKVTRLTDRDKKLDILGSSYAQYARIEGDFRHYTLLPRGQTLVSRLNAAIGVPYGNSSVLPYIKQYFVGGPNSVRAFRIRSIGPGTFGSFAVPDSIIIDEFDRTGDIKLEANVEWRFPIISLLKGAVFADLGNIWTLREETSGTDPDTGNPIYTRPGGQFKANSLWNEIAIGTGFGMRLDFSFFVMRFDLGIPLRNPSLAKGERWVIENTFEKKWLLNNMNLNLAIGYPF